jgi:hypothetical protein
MTNTQNEYSIRNQASGDVLDVYHGTDGRVGTLAPTHGQYVVRVLIPGRVAWILGRTTGDINEAYAMIDAVRRES